MVNELKARVDITTQSAITNLNNLNKSIRQMGLAMERMPIKNLEKIFTISDAVSNSLSQSGMSKQWTFMSDAVSNATKSLGSFSLNGKKAAEMSGSITTALGHSLRNTNGFTNAFKELQIQTSKTTKSLSATDMVMRSLSKNTKKSIKLLKQNRGALMGIAFAALFGGMALKRMFSGALKSIFNTYKETMNATSEFNQMTNQLNGAWTFFKFTLVDALMQSGLFQTMIGFVIRLVTNIGKFTSKHPDITKLIGIFLILGLVLSSIVMVMGQLGLAMLSFALLEGIAIAPILLAFTKILLVISYIVIVMNIIIKVWKTSLSTGVKVFTTIAIVALALVGVFVLLGIVGLAAFFAIVAAIAIVIAAILIFKDTIVSAFQYAFTFVEEIWEKLINKIIVAYYKTRKMLSKDNQSYWQAKIDTQEFESLNKVFDIQARRINYKDNLGKDFTQDKNKLKELFGIDELKQKMDAAEANVNSYTDTEKLDNSKEQLEISKIQKDIAEISLNIEESQLDETKKLNLNFEDFTNRFSQGLKGDFSGFNSSTTQ